jgi:hypothetical protein
MPIPRWFCPLTALALACALHLEAAVAAPDTAPAYHGGALVVTNPGLAQGHLAPGQILPIRLSRLTRPADGPPPLQGTETPGSVRYGQLEFLQVSPASVTFSVAFRDGGPARTITLRRGESVDLAGDGVPTLALQAPVKALQAGGDAIDYALLAFACDAGHTAMFALAPEAFEGGRYPYGISGLTPAGQFIFQTDCLGARPTRGPGKATLVFPEQAGPAFQVRPDPGDVLVEAQSGRFGAIQQVDRTVSGLEIRYAPAATPFLFRDVFGAACVQVSGNLAELARRYRCGPAALWDTSLTLVDIARAEPLLDDPRGQLALQLAARLSVDLSLSVNANYHGISAGMAAYLDETLRLAVDGHLQLPFSKQFGPLSLARNEVGFAIYGVPLAVSLDLTGGLDVDSQDTGTLLEGISATGRWGWSSNVAATWGWRGIKVNAPAPVPTNTLVIQGLPENASSMTGQGSVRPWLTLIPKLKFASCLFAECPSALAATALVRTSAGPGAPAAHAQLDVDYQLKAGIGFELPLFGHVWDRTWPLYTWSDTVWAQDWLKPSAATAP